MLDWEMFFSIIGGIDTYLQTYGIFPIRADSNFEKSLYLQNSVSAVGMSSISCNNTSIHRSLNRTE